MPGEKWSDKELEILLNAKLSGLSGAEIRRLLPGRSIHSIAQVVRRNNWADQRLSKKMKEAIQLNGPRHQLFVEFLKKNSTAPIEQITNSWNSWATAQGLPTINASRVGYWIGKLGLPHSRSEVWQSNYAKKKRRSKREVVYQEKFKEFEAAVSIELKRRKDLQAKKIARLKKQGLDQQVERTTCECCQNTWLLEKTFFSKLPISFSFQGKRLNEFQTGFCLFCSWRVRNELLLKRAFDIDVMTLIDNRKHYRRVGFDRAFEKVIEQAKLKRDRALENGLSPDKLQTCPRCLDSWERNKKNFRPNPKKANGKSSLRGICTYCDHYFETAIDRRIRDNQSYQDLLDQRAKYLKLARQRQ